MPIWDTSIGDTFNQKMNDLSVDSLGIILPPASAVDTFKEKFTITGRSFTFTNGPVGQTTYYDHAMYVGWNLTKDGVQLDTSKPSIYNAFESKFYQNAAFQSEFQLRCITASGQFTRPYELSMPYSGIGNTFLVSCANVIFGTETLDTPSTTAVVTISPRGADDGSLETVTVTPLSTMASGAAALRVKLPTVTGKSVYAYAGVGNTNAELINGLRNLNTSNGTVSNLLEMASGWAQSVYSNTTNGKEWALGQVASTGKFVISASRIYNNTFIALSIDYTTQQVTFSYPSKHALLTVATLPAAATAGAGSSAFCTDLSGASYVYGAAAVGGGTRAGKVFSTGAAWLEG